LRTRTAITALYPLPLHDALPILLRAIAGLDAPSRGRVALDGMTVTAPHEKIGIIFQEPRLLPWLTVAGNVAFGIEHLPRRERDEDRKSTRLNSSHVKISYAVFCL